MSALFKSMSKDKILELQEWAVKEFYRQENESGLNYLICEKWHPVIRIHLCKLIINEATVEML